MTSRTASLVLGLALTVAAACGGGGEGDAKESTTSTTSGSTAPAPTPASNAEGVPTLSDAEGAFDDLTVDECTVTPGAVAANGSIANTTEDAADFVLLVRWVEPEGNGVIDSASVVVEDLAPGATEDWSVEGEVTTDSDAVCSYSLERGTI